MPRNEQAEKKVRISFRLPASLKERLDAAVNSPTKRSYGDFFLEKIHNWLSESATSIDDVDRKVRVQGQLFVIASFGEHALNRGEYAWACREFRRLEQATRVRLGDSGLSLIQFAMFRQAFCHWAMADQLRKAAHAISANGEPIDSRRTGFEEAARESERLVLRTIRLCEKFLANEEHRLVRYNLACSHSFHAGLLVEKALLCNTDCYEFVQNALAKGHLWTDDADSLANNWREIWRALKLADMDRVDSSANAALFSLHELSKQRPGADRDKDVIEGYELWASMCPVDQHWLIQETKVDPDFDFLRNDVSWREQYDKWYCDCGGESKANKPIERLLTSAEQIRRLYKDDENDDAFG